MKKSLTFIFLMVAAIWGIGQIDLHQVYTKANCPFCDRTIVAKQLLYRGNGCTALLNYKPAVPGHALIVPNRHVERFEDLTVEELAEIQILVGRVDEAAKKTFGATGYLLLQKNGQEAGQSVPHVHFHYLPRKVGENHIWFAVKLFAAPWLKSLSAEEMQAIRLRFERE
jgi:diadenosine tetraphosphate (Ap4A) HIT family hydrolase